MTRRRPYDPIAESNYLGELQKLLQRANDPALRRAQLRQRNNPHHFQLWINGLAVLNVWPSKSRFQAVGTDAPSQTGSPAALLAFLSGLPRPSLGSRKYGPLSKQVAHVIRVLSHYLVTDDENALVEAGARIDDIVEEMFAKNDRAEFGDGRDDYVPYYEIADEE